MIFYYKKWLWSLWSFGRSPPKLGLETSWMRCSSSFPPYSSRAPNSQPAKELTVQADVHLANKLEWRVKEWGDIKRVKREAKEEHEKDNYTKLRWYNLEQGITKNRNCECAIRKIAKQFIVGQLWPLFAKVPFWSIHSDLWIIIYWRFSSPSQSAFRRPGLLWRTRVPASLSLWAQGCFQVPIKLNVVHLIVDDNRAE